MQNLLSKKIKVLKEAAIGVEVFDLDCCDIVLKNPENFPDSTECYIRNIEAKICERVSQESHRAFYNKLNEINKEIERYKRSCLKNF